MIRLNYLFHTQTETDTQIITPQIIYTHKTEPKNPFRKIIKNNQQKQC